MITNLLKSGKRCIRESLILDILNKRWAPFFVYLYLQLTILFLVSVISNKFRSSHCKYSVKKGVLTNFAKFTGKHLCQNLFFNKAAGLACNFIEKETLPQHRCFPMKIAKFLRPPFLQNTRRLLLSIIIRTVHSEYNK